jgi:hypothetical protein
MGSPHGGMVHARDHARGRCGLRYEPGYAAPKDPEEGCTLPTLYVCAHQLHSERWETRCPRGCHGKRLGRRQEVIVTDNG